jgi:hypothetical protein
MDLEPTTGTLIPGHPPDEDDAFESNRRKRIFKVEAT